MEPSTRDAHATTGAGRRDRVLAPADLRRLSERSDLQGLARYALHLALVAAAAVLVAHARGTWWLPAAMLLQGWFLVALFAPVHECIHHTAFRTRWLNDVLGWIASVPTLVNASFYRLFHHAHHRHAQDRLRDPELAGPPPATTWQYALRLAGWGYYTSRVSVFGRILRDRWDGMDFIPARERPAVRRSVAAMLALVLAAFASWSWLDPAGPWLHWLLPVAMAQPILRAMLLSEHTLCSDDDDGLSNTRTTLAAWPLRLVHWNMPFHAEHHLYPSIPFFNLPRAHELVRDRLVHVAGGYLETQGRILDRIARRA